MLMSVLMSAPGPLVVGLGLLAGRSSTQLADFVRRSSELLALIVAWIVYRMTNREALASQDSPAALEAQLNRKARLERRSNLFVGAVMVLSGSAMLFITLFSENTEKGNVLPGLIIAILGVIANTIFWVRYTRLSRQTGNSILAVQARLYRAKSLVDICVTTALATVMLFPGSPASIWLDRIGSIIVALYLVWCGIKTLREQATLVKDSAAAVDPAETAANEPGRK